MEHPVFVYGTDGTETFSSIDTALTAAITVPDGDTVKGYYQDDASKSTAEKQNPRIQANGYTSADSCTGVAYDNSGQRYTLPEVEAAYNSIQDTIHFVNIDTFEVKNCTDFADYKTQFGL